MRGENLIIVPGYFPCLHRQGLATELLDRELARFDLARIAAALKPERDMDFQFLGLQTLYDRYFPQTRDERAATCRNLWACATRQNATFEVSVSS